MKIRKTLLFSWILLNLAIFCTSNSDDEEVSNNNPNEESSDDDDVSGK